MFEWHIFGEEIVTCFLDSHGQRTGVSYSFFFESALGAMTAWENVQDPMILVRMAWENDVREEEKSRTSST